MNQSPMSHDEIAVWHLYTQESPFYMILNARMRSEDRTMVKPFLDLVMLMQVGLLKLPVKRAMLFRGVKKPIGGLFSKGV